MSDRLSDLKFAKHVLMAISDDALIEQALGVWRRHAHCDAHEQMGITLVVAVDAAIRVALGDMVNDLGTVAMAGEA